MKNFEILLAALLFETQNGSVLLQFWQETDKAAYLLRQYFFNNLHDRLSTRPFLNLVEKKWLAFQVFLFIFIFSHSNIAF